MLELERSGFGVGGGVGAARGDARGEGESNRFGTMATRLVFCKRRPLLWVLLLRCVRFRGALTEDSTASCELFVAETLFKIEFLAVVSMGNGIVFVGSVVGGVESGGGGAAEGD